MDSKLVQDIDHFFALYESRTEDILRPLLRPAQDELAEELALLKISVINRIKEAQSR